MRHVLIVRYHFYWLCVWGFWLASREWLLQDTNTGAEEGNHASELRLEILLLWHRQFPGSFIKAGWTSAPRLKRSRSSQGAWGGDGHRKELEWNGHRKKGLGSSGRLALVDSMEKCLILGWKGGLDSIVINDIFPIKWPLRECLSCSATVWNHCWPPWFRAVACFVLETNLASSTAHVLIQHFYNSEMRRVEKRLWFQYFLVEWRFPVPIYKGLWLLCLGDSVCRRKIWL